MPDSLNSWHVTPKTKTLIFAVYDAIPHRDDRLLDVFGVFGGRGDDATGGGQVTKQAAGGAIWRVHGTEESPGLRQKLPHRRRSELREIGSSVNRPEVGKVPVRAQGR